MIYSPDLKSLRGSVVRITYLDSNGRITARVGTVYFTGPVTICLSMPITGYTRRIPTDQIIRIDESNGNSLPGISPEELADRIFNKGFIISWHGPSVGGYRFEVVRPATPDGCRALLGMMRRAGFAYSSDDKMWHMIFLDAQRGQGHASNVREVISYGEQNKA